MLKFYIALTIFSSSINKSMLQESRCSTDYALISNRSNENPPTWLEDEDYEGFLEICFYIQTEANALLWKPVCGGELWTNNEARVACNQLGYPNTTTLATTRGLCSNPNNISDGVEVTGCSGTETNFGMCQSSTANCNLWAGIICTSLEFCSDEICSNSTYCHPTPTCSNCSIPQVLNCICYGECDPPCTNGGSCVYNNTCQCPPYWTGQHCEQSLLPMPDIKTYTDKALPMRNVSTCLVTCLNGGSCSSAGKCICTENYDGNQCGNIEGFNSLVLSVIISILISLLIFSVFIGTIAIIVIYRKTHKNNKRTLNRRTKNDNQTVSLPQDEHLFDLILQDSQNKSVDLQDNTAYHHNSTHHHKCDEDKKSETNFTILNIIATGNYDIVEPVVKDNLSLEQNNMCPEYAEVQDVPDRNASETTMTPANVQNPDDSCQEYSELNNAYKEEQRSLTLDKKMKGHQRQLGNYSKLDHGMLLQPRNQPPSETYSTLDMSNSENQYHNTEHKLLLSDCVMNDSVKTKLEDAVSKELPKGIYVETKNEFLNCADETDEGSQLIKTSDKDIINYDHCTL